MKQSTGRESVLLVALALAVAASFVASPAVAELDGDEAERLARALWFEGIPDERIEPLTAAAVGRLAALLADPEESAHHATALDLLGRGGGPGAYEVVAASAAPTPEGDVDAGLYRGRLAIGLALGYLARDDDRALADLVRAARRSGPADWQHRHLRPERMRRLLRESALTGLAISGRPESVELLRDFAGGSRGGTDASGGDTQLSRHAAAMLDVHGRSRPAHDDREGDEEGGAEGGAR